MRTAVVHDWLTGMRGGEFVLEEILDLVPDPTIFTLFHFPGSVSAKIESRPIRTSLLQHFVSRRHYRSLLPLFPAAVESFDLEGFDFVVSSSHCVAKGAIPRQAPHLCYCHTPVRYAYDQFDAYFSPEKTRFYGLRKYLIGRLRRWDQATSGRVGRYLANSSRVAERIAAAYRRNATVVPPPVDVDFFTPDAGPADGYALCVSALVAYKRLDVAIAWANQTGHRLVIVGDGPDEKHLRALASSSVQFERNLSREDLRDRYRRSAFFLQPGEEDFGMAAVEAQACGRPVVALARGGVRDIVENGKTGVLFSEPTPAGISAAIDSLGKLGSNPGEARTNAERFGRPIFRAGFCAARDAMLNA